MKWTQRKSDALWAKAFKADIALTREARKRDILDDDQILAHVWDYKKTRMGLPCGCKVCKCWLASTNARYDALTYDDTIPVPVDE